MTDQNLLDSLRTPPADFFKKQEAEVTEKLQKDPTFKSSLLNQIFDVAKSSDNPAVLEALDQLASVILLAHGEEVNARIEKCKKEAAYRTSIEIARREMQDQVQESAKVEYAKRLSEATWQQKAENTTLDWVFESEGPRKTSPMPLRSPIGKPTT